MTNQNRERMLKEPSAKKQTVESFLVIRARATKNRTQRTLHLAVAGFRGDSMRFNRRPRAASATSEARREASGD